MISPTSKRHCMIVFALYPLGETRVQREAEALVRQGYEVDVICVRLPGDRAVDNYKGVRIFREQFKFPISPAKRGGLGEKLLFYIRFFISAAIRLTQLHLQKRYDTIQVHNLPDFLVFCALIPKLLGTPILLDLHDLMPEFYTGQFGQGSPLISRLIRLQEQLSCRFADHVITVSEHWRRALIGRGVPADKCSVVMNVADESIFRPSNNGNHNHRHSGDEFRLIYHGAMLRRYGLDLAVQAIDHLRHEIPGIHLFLVGEGEFLPTLKDLVEQLQLQEYVTIEPARLVEELQEILLSCDLGVVPYLNDVFTDGLLPTKLMEYAALELPAVAARTTTIWSYFNDSNVEFFEPGDLDDLTRCIKNLYLNPDRLAVLAHRSGNFNKRYCWSMISEMYVSLVKQLIEGNHGT
jgi:glycosyltransferase involved in cell wall biosynthesis